MLGQQQAETLLKQVLGYSKAGETEVLIRAHDAALTRYANSIIHQNVAETDVIVTVRAVAGKRMGTASTNDLSAEALALRELKSVQEQLQALELAIERIATRGR